jgi:hypothetical protein
LNRDGTIRIAFEIVLPQLHCPRLGVPIWGKVTGVVEGRADPERALAAFDAARARPPEAVFADIGQNVRGWASWAAGEIFRIWVTERDPLELVLQDHVGQADLIALLLPQFSPWSCQLQSAAVRLELDPACAAMLPPAAQARLKPPAPAGPPTVAHQFQGDIPPVQDPVTHFDMKVRCRVNVTFVFDLALARMALDPPGTMPLDQLQTLAVNKAEEWFWYGVKQSFYNWIFDASRPHRRFVRDYTLIHAEVMALSQEGLGRMGVTVSEAMVRYEALDPDSAWALTAPGQSAAGPAVRTTPGGGIPKVVAGSSPGLPTQPASVADTAAPIPTGGPRGGSDQAMAATIAVSDVSELPASMGRMANGQLPPIEEAVWRHQKRIVKKTSGLSRAEIAKEILAALKADGYSMEDRKRIATIIGARPEDVTD